MSDESTKKIDLSALGLCLQIAIEAPDLAAQVYRILGAYEVQELRAALAEERLPGLHTQLQYPDGLPDRLAYLDSAAADAMVEAVYTTVTDEAMRIKAAEFFAPTQAQPVEPKPPGVVVENLQPLAPPEINTDVVQLMPKELLVRMPLVFLAGLVAVGDKRASEILTQTYGVSAEVLAQLQRGEGFDLLPQEPII